MFFFLLALCVTLGVAFAGNLVTLYLFYEFLSFATYPLVIHERSPEAMKSGKKYILYSLSGAGLLLVAIVLTHHLAGNLAFGAGPILEGLSGPGLNWLLLLFALGFGVKAAVMPLHHWLPISHGSPDSGKRPPPCRSCGIFRCLWDSTGGLFGFRPGTGRGTGFQ